MLERARADKPTQATGALSIYFCFHINEFLAMRSMTVSQRFSPPKAAEASLRRIVSTIFMLLLIISAIVFFQSKFELYQINCAHSQGLFLTAISFKFVQFKRRKIPIATRVFFTLHFRI